MKYSISESARIVGITRKTLYKHIDKKPISTEKDDNGRPVIDASELIRIYGDKCKFNINDGNKETGQGIQGSTQKETAISNDEAIKNAVIKKEVELLRHQMASDRDSFEEQIDYLRKKLDESTGESRKLTALITDKSKDNKSDEWQKSIEKLEKRISNQEDASKEKEADALKTQKQNAALKKALAEERSKGFFKKLFG